VNSSERALRALRTQVQFELAQAGMRVAQAAALSAGVQRRVDTLTQAREAAARELRAAMHRPQVNPALLAEMRKLYLAEQHALHDSASRLAAARQLEQRARDELAGVRNRDRSLERGLQAEQRNQQLKQRGLEGAQVDDLWLQHARRASV